MHLVHIELGLDTGLYMRDDKFTTISGIVNPHPKKRLHWVAQTNEKYFDFYGVPPACDTLKYSTNKFNPNIGYSKLTMIICFQVNLRIIFILPIYFRWITKKTVRKLNYFRNIQ